MLILVPTPTVYVSSRRYTPTNIAPAARLIPNGGLIRKCMRVIGRQGLEKCIFQETFSNPCVRSPTSMSEPRVFVGRLN